MNNSLSHNFQMLQQITGRRSTPHEARIIDDGITTSLSSKGNYFSRAASTSTSSDASSTSSSNTDSSMAHGIFKALYAEQEQRRRRANYTGRSPPMVDHTTDQWRVDNACQTVDRSISPLVLNPQGSTALTHDMTGGEQSSVSFAGRPASPSCCQCAVSSLMAEPNSRGKTVSNERDGAGVTTNNSEISDISAIMRNTRVPKTWTAEQEELDGDELYPGSQEEYESLREKGATSYFLNSSGLSHRQTPVKVKLQFELTPEKSAVSLLSSLSAVKTPPATDGSSSSRRSPLLSSKKQPYIPGGDPESCRQRRRRRDALLEEVEKEYRMRCTFHPTVSPLVQSRARQQKKEKPNCDENKPPSDDEVNPVLVEDAAACRGEPVARRLYDVDDADEDFLPREGRVTSEWLTTQSPHPSSSVHDPTKTEGGGTKKQLNREELYHIGCYIAGCSRLSQDEEVYEEHDQGGAFCGVVPTALSTPQHVKPVNHSLFEEACGGDATKRLNKNVKEENVSGANTSAVSTEKGRHPEKATHQNAGGDVDGDKRKRSSNRNKATEIADDTTRCGSAISEPSSPFEHFLERQRFYSETREKKLNDVRREVTPSFHPQTTPRSAVLKEKLVERVLQQHHSQRSPVITDNKREEVALEEDAENLDAGTEYEEYEVTIDLEQEEEEKGKGQCIPCTRDQYQSTDTSRTPVVSLSTTTVGTTAVKKPCDPSVLTRRGRGGESDGEPLAAAVERHQSLHLPLSYEVLPHSRKAAKMDENHNKPMDNVNQPLSHGSKKSRNSSNGRLSSAVRLDLYAPGPHKKRHADPLESGCTFRPMITPAAKRLAPRPRHCEALYEEHRRRDQMQQEAQKRAEEEELRGLTFEPKLNPNRGTTSALKVGNFSKYEALRKKKEEYLQQQREALQRERERKEMEECTFRPQLSKTPSYLSRIASEYNTLERRASSYSRMNSGTSDHVYAVPVL